MESVSTIFLIDLALDLSGDWVKLARALGLEDKVERISRDNENNVAEQAYRMLLTWKQGNGALATLEVLSEALRKSTVSRKDLAQKYCENSNQGSSNAEINLGRQLRSGQILQDDMTSISKDLGKDWLWVGRLLGIEDTELDNFKQLYKQLNECSYYMLKTWARTRGDQATYELLARALLHRAVGKRDIAEKYCLERRQPQRVSTGAAEGWDVPDSPLSPPESRPRVENAEEEQAPPAECLWHKNIMSVSGFQSAFKEIEKLLDPDRPLGGNYKTLAGVYGMSQSDILYLGYQQNPTEVLLQKQNPTLDKLRKDLLGEEMERSDVVDVMKKWIETNCTCQSCNTSR